MSGRSDIRGIVTWLIVIVERHIAINRFGRGATRSTDVTWEWRAFVAVMKRPSTYVFFVSYICLLIVAVALGTFLPTILKVVRFSLLGVFDIKLTVEVRQILKYKSKRIYFGSLFRRHRLLCDLVLAL